VILNFILCGFKNTLILGHSLVNKNTNIYLTLLVVALVTGVSIAVFHLKSNHINQFLTNLASVNKKVSFELQRQSDNMILDMEDLLSDTEERSLIIYALNAKKVDKSTQFELRKSLSRELFARHYKGYYLINRDKQIIAAMKDADISAVLPATPLSIITRLDYGEKAIISHPFLFKDKLGMWVMHTVRDYAGNEIGYLAVVAGNPHRFSVTTAVTGIGFETTETYLIDQDGFMLSESRFIKQLTQMGFLTKDEKTTLNVQATDPGINLLQTALKTTQKVDSPLTFAAQRAINDKSTGISSTPYRDYRGVMVMGTWQWNKRLNAAIITKTDKSEVMAGFYVNNHRLKAGGFKLRLKADHFA